MRLNALLFGLLCCLTASAAFSQKTTGGFNFRVKLDNYDQSELLLGFYLGEKQYVKDTAQIGKDGYFTFSADTLLPCGVYLLVMKPENTYIQFLVSGDKQQFTLHVDAKKVAESMKVKGSDENAAFYEYLAFLSARREEADTLRARMKGVPEQDSLKRTEDLAKLDQTVKEYQKNFVKKHGNKLAGKIVNAAIEPELPKFDGDEETVRKSQYYWYRAHFFDNMDITDVCLLNSPVLHPRVDQFITKVVPQHPDSISKEIDGLLRQMKGSPELYKYYLIHFLNFYAKSNIVGMDAVYVHIAQEYYCKGDANWAKKEDIEKICDNSVRLAPILIGKTAPDITVFDREGQPQSLWGVDADYTVVFFWDPECSHCKKAAPHIVDFASKYKDRGVKVFAVCTAVGDKEPECWKNVEEKGFNDGIIMNFSDPKLRSRFKQLYDVRATPQIFILSRDHEILLKRIGAEQLPTVMEELMKFQAEKKGK